jgi:phenylacetate-CoA ligase
MKPGVTDSTLIVQRIGLRVLNRSLKRGTPQNPQSKRELTMIFDKQHECMSRDDLTQLQIERLQTTLRRVCRSVAFYQEAFDREKIDIEKIRTLADIRHLPFTTKSDLRKSYPYGMFAVPLRDIVRIHATSGTTGKPIVAGYTRNDIRHWSDLVARNLCAAGVTDHDMVQIAFNYSLFTGGLGFHYGAELVGASVIPTSSNANVTDQLMVMRDYKTTVLVTLPSHALAIAAALEKMGLNPREMQLRIGVFGAEPWSEKVRQTIESRLLCAAYDTYGVAEIIGPGIAGECSERNGLHINEDHFIAEVIDPVTLDPVRDGETGELVFTTITKEGFPLIRYRTGDRASLDPQPCACGRTLARMSRISGRTDDLIIIQGVKVFPSQIQELLAGCKGLDPRIRIVVDRHDNADVMELHVTLSDIDNMIDDMRKIEQLRAEILRTVENALGITPKVVIVEPSSLDAEGGKNLRVIDRRNA